MLTVPPDADIRPLGPGTVSWRLHADPMMWIAGLRALYLQALHPRVIRGFIQNSDFRADTWGRLIRTANYVGATTFGTVEEAHRAAARVRRIHERLDAVDLGTGERYGVGAPDLLLWVHNCEVDSYLSVIRRAGLRISDAEADAYLQEQRWRAWLIGIDPRTVPATVEALEAYFTAARHAATATPEARDAARFIVFPPMNLALNLSLARPGWAGVGAVAFGTLPTWARQMYGFRAPVPRVGTTAALRAMRLTALSVPRPLREGRHVRAAKRRISAAGG